MIYETLEQLKTNELAESEDHRHLKRIETVDPIHLDCDPPLIVLGTLRVWWSSVDSETRSCVVSIVEEGQVGQAALGDRNGFVQLLTVAARMPC